MQWLLFWCLFKHRIVRIKRHNPSLNGSKIETKFGIGINYSLNLVNGCINLVNGGVGRVFGKSYHKFQLR